jgi:hypothetical protein
LADNSRLDQSLKDKHRVAIMKKQKEIEGACQKAEAANQKREACRTIIQHLHALLLGKCSSQFFSC